MLGLEDLNELPLENKSDRFDCQDLSRQPCYNPAHKLFCARKRRESDGRKPTRPMDITLAVVIGITQLLLGAMGVYVSLRPPDKRYHAYWLTGFIAVGLAGVVLTACLTKRGSDAQEKMEQELQGSRIEQARMSGHLEGIQAVMENISKTGLPGVKEFADSLRQWARANTEQANATKISNSETCKRAHAEASKIRAFEAAFDNEIDKSRDASFEAMRTATTDASRNELDRKMADDMRQLYLKHDAAFREEYLAESKFIRDTIMERLAPSERERLFQSNIQADTNLFTGWLAGAGSERDCELSGRIGYVTVPTKE